MLKDERVTACKIGDYSLVLLDCLVWGRVARKKKPVFLKYSECMCRDLTKKLKGFCGFKVPDFSFVILSLQQHYVSVQTVQS